MLALKIKFQCKILQSGCPRCTCNVIQYSVLKIRWEGDGVLPVTSLMPSLAASSRAFVLVDFLATSLHETKKTRLPSITTAKGE